MGLDRLRRKSNLAVETPTSQVSAYWPQAEMHDYIVELRSLTLGTSSFHWKYDRLQEIAEKVTKQVLARQ